MRLRSIHFIKFESVSLFPEMKSKQMSHNNKLEARMPMALFSKTYFALACLINLSKEALSNFFK